MTFSWNNIERWVWWIFLVTLAWQTRVILWQADATFIEWRSMALYASDVLMGGLFALAVPRIKHWSLDRWDYLWAALIAISGLSLVHAPLPSVGLYDLARLVQCILFFWYLRHWAWQRFDIDESAVAFVGGALVQSVLALTQYGLQRDVGLRWMGETLLHPDMRGVAVFIAQGHEKILRAYGTLPHPNILAAYLAVALWIFGWLYLRHGRRGHEWLWASCGTVVLWALYATYSRTMIATVAMAAVALVLVVWSRRAQHWASIAHIRSGLARIAVLAAIASVCFGLGQYDRIKARMTIASSDEAVQLRIKYAHDALDSGGSWHINWLGVGLGNFTSWLAINQPHLPAWQVQPAHNLYLLIYSEIGLGGVVLWVVWLVHTLRSGWRGHRGQPFVRLGLTTLVGAFLTIALFDHFFWTLQQGHLLWWGVLALVAGPVDVRT